MRRPWNVFIVAGLIAGCGGPSTTTLRYDSPNADASLTVTSVNYGGAAGFVRNHIGLEAGGVIRGEIRTLEHLSGHGVRWITDDKVVFCYVGAMDRGEPRWIGTVGGRVFELVLEDRTEQGVCG